MVMNGQHVNLLRVHVEVGAGALGAVTVDDEKLPRVSNVQVVIEPGGATLTVNIDDRATVTLPCQWLTLDAEAMDLIHPDVRDALRQLGVRDGPG